MIDQESVERAAERFKAPDGALERLIRRRDRKRRKQRIAAGVVGIAVFVAAVWIVTSGGTFDQSTPAVPGGSETGPAETAPPRAPASAAPEDVVRTGTCSGSARWRLELTDMGLGGPIEMRFELHRSPVGHSWRIVIRHSAGPLFPPSIAFRGTRVASESGDLAVQRRTSDFIGADVFEAKAVDTQTGQVCRASGEV